MGDVQEEAERTEAIVEEVQDEAKKSFSQVLGIVHAGWLATQGVVRAMGGSISTVFRTLVGTGLGAIQTLQPILKAALHGGLATMSPYMIAQASLGLLSMGAAISALVAYEAEEKEFSDALRGANMALHGVSAMLGYFPTM